MESFSLLFAFLLVLCVSFVPKLVHLPGLDVIGPFAHSNVEKAYGGIMLILRSLLIRAHLRTFVELHYRNLSICLIPTLVILIYKPYSIYLHIGAAVVAFSFIIFISREIFRAHPFPKQIRSLLTQPQAASELPKLWELPEDLTEEELGLLKYFSSITWQLGEGKEWVDVWAMNGGGDACPQLGFTSARYHLAFAAYAVAAACQRTPAYTGEARRVLGWLLARLLERRVWGYMPHYWRGSEAQPFRCHENVMWSAHVLHVAALYEALTGDCRFRQPRSLRALPGAAPYSPSATAAAAGDEPIVAATAAAAVGDGPGFVADAARVARLCACGMRRNPTGGMPCEPGMVFVQCNNHQLVAFRTFASLGVDFSCRGDCERAPQCDVTCDGTCRCTCDTTAVAAATADDCDGDGDDGDNSLEIDGKSDAGDGVAASDDARGDGDGDEDGDSFAAERRRWESFLLGSMRAPVSTGTFKLMAIDRAPGDGSSVSGASVPFGHLGSDGWDLAYYFAWAAHPDIPSRIWHTLTAPLLRRFSTLQRPPCNSSGGSGGGNSSGGAGGGCSDNPPPNSCCLGLNIPASVWLTALLPVAAQAGDASTAASITAWLQRYYRRSDSDGRVWLAEGTEWSIGNSANYLLGLALGAGSSLRALALRPTPRSFFRGPILCDVEPPRSVQVVRCRRGATVSAAGAAAGAGGVSLHCALLVDAGVERVALRLQNVPQGGVALQWIATAAAAAAAGGGGASGGGGTAQSWAWSYEAATCTGYLRRHAHRRDSSNPPASCRGEGASRASERLEFELLMSDSSLLVRAPQQ